jgi:NAD(P)-dependent dehydrogenase (short-subunit alcohol dehydrogenase family)
MTINIIITGANRGIGLALTQHYALRGVNVYAVCRTASLELTNIPSVTVVEGIDVTKAEDLDYLSTFLTDVNIDVLINNAGILSEEVLGEIDASQIEQQFKVNALAPLLTTEALLGNLHSGAKVVLMSSRMGSLADNNSGSSYGYRMSKAALNAAGVSLAIDLKPKGISISLLHPGFVQTELVGNQGDVTTDEAAKQLIERISEINLDNTGTFKHANGRLLPW